VSGRPAAPGGHAAPRTIPRMATNTRARSRRPAAAAGRRGAPRPAAVVRPSLPPAELPYAAARQSTAGRLLLGAPVAVIALGVVLLGLGIVVAGAVVLGAVVLLVASGWVLGTPSRLVRLLGAHPAEPVADARYINVAEGLCVAHGLPLPELLVLDDSAANALTLGASEEHAHLIVTRGALASLDRMELEGLIAHELAHVKRGDTRASALAIRVIGPLLLCTGRSARPLRRVGDPTRELAADLLGAAMTRYPPGLRRALEKLNQAPNRAPARAGVGIVRLTAPFWCAPLDEGFDEAVVPGVLDLELRVAALAEL
jgi:Zn-dependent protease with chaperone function